MESFDHLHLTEDGASLLCQKEETNFPDIVLQVINVQRFFVDRNTHSLWGLSDFNIDTNEDDFSTRKMKNSRFGFDITLSDGVRKLKCLLHARMNHLVELGSLVPNVVIVVQEHNVLIDEARVGGREFVLIEQLILVSPPIKPFWSYKQQFLNPNSDEHEDQDDDDDDKNQEFDQNPHWIENQAGLVDNIPLTGVRKYYMMLWNGESVDGSLWAHSALPKLSPNHPYVDERVDIDTITSSFASNKLNANANIPLFGTIVKICKIVHWGKPQSYSQEFLPIIFFKLHKCVCVEFSGLQISISTIRDILDHIMRMAISKASEFLGESDSALYKVCSSVREKIRSINSLGKLDNDLIAAASGSDMTYGLAEGELEAGVYYLASNIKNLSTQIISVVLALSLAAENLSYVTVFVEMCSVIHAVVGRMESLLDYVETTQCVLQNKHVMDVSPDVKAIEDPLGGATSAFQALSVEDDEASVNIWDKYSDKDKHYTWIEGKDCKKVIRFATLNKLVEILTSDSYYDNHFLETFVTTFASFTSPSRVLDKLLERYNCPEYVESAMKAKIQLRVTVFLKHFIRTQFDEMDERTVSRIQNFVETSLQVDGYANISKLLSQELEHKVLQRSTCISSLLIPPTDIMIPNEKASPATIFVNMSESEISRQLTLIDFEIFEVVRPRELMNQAWNRPKLKHRAQNIVRIVERSNKTAYWVASMILREQSLSNRSEMIIKFVNISNDLMKIHNFHTLMGVIVGLNLACISRLKKSWADVPKQTMDILKELESLMSLDHSFKNYRISLKNCALPVLPYIGVCLSDLTFIEDGNPNKIDGKINFERRELVYTVISDLRHFMRTRYQFPVVEPIHTFLLELPSLPEKDLYSLSLEYEPRQQEEPLGQKSSKSKKRDLYHTLQRRFGQHK